MGKHPLLHRADCEASGVGEQYSIAIKDRTDYALYLCEHHTRSHSAALTAAGWLVVALSEYREAVGV